MVQTWSLPNFKNMHFMEMSLGPNSPGLENIRTLFSLKVKLGQHGLGEVPNMILHVHVALAILTQS